VLHFHSFINSPFAPSLFARMDRGEGGKEGRREGGREGKGEGGQVNDFKGELRKTRKVVFSFFFLLLYTKITVFSPN